VAALCRKVFTAPAPGPITTEGVDEAWILASWIRHRTDGPDDLTVAVDPTDLSGTARELKRVLDRFLDPLNYTSTPEED
jgi:hypothetical protein